MVAEQNPRAGSEGQVQNHARVPGTGGEWRAVGTGLDDMAVLSTESALGASGHGQSVGPWEVFIQFVFVLMSVCQPWPLSCLSSHPLSLPLLPGPPTLCLSQLSPLSGSPASLPQG